MPGMRSSFKVRWAKLAGVSLLAGLGAACSSDVARFGDPFANPFQSRAAYDPVATNSINRRNVPNAPLAPAPVASVASQPLPAPNAPLITGSTGSVAPPGLPLAPPSRGPAVVGSASNWTTVGGTPVTLQPGEGIGTLSARYGVPVGAILAANGLSSPAQARPGQSIVIPAYTAGAPAPSPSAVAPVSRVASVAPPKIPASTPMLSPVPPRARAVGTVESSDAEKRAADKLAAMKKQAAEDARKRKEAELARQKAAKLEADRKLAEKKLAARPSDPETTGSIAPAARPSAPAPAAERSETEAATSASPAFRWPAQGRVIAGFGARGTGGANDGINIAVPEGTPVRAAEAGTVVHADDALKGYGKLVLVRHASGYVSVYAHNSEIRVRRGESVKRGQVIAASGQSGNVTSPQLHFEIRKGATPVDPMKYLAAN